MSNAALLAILDRISKTLSSAALFIASIALVVMTVTFGWLVFGRYVLNATPTWVEQTSLLLVVVITFLGAAAGIYERTHLSITYFKDNSPSHIRKFCSLFSHAALGAFGTAMVVYGYQLTVFKWSSDIPLLGVPEGLRAIPIVVSGALVLLFSLYSFIERLRRKSEVPLV